MLGLLAYEEVHRAALTALSCREHVLIMGEPGGAKSEFVRKLFSCIDNAQVWETQLTKSSDESQIFGIPNIEALLKGEVQYADRIPALEAQLWNVDEVFDAADVVMRSVLSVMNERTFIRGSVPRKANLHSCLATANYIRVNELTKAFVDRIAIVVNAPVLSIKDRVKLYDESTFKMGKVTRYTLDKFDELGERAKAVTIPEPLVRGLVDMAGRHGFSPRRERKLARLVRVYTTIMKKTVADAACLEPFKWLLPPTIKEADRIRALKDLTDAVGALDQKAAQASQLASAREALKDPNELPLVVSILKSVLANPVHEDIRRDAEAVLAEADKKYSNTFQNLYCAVEEGDAA